MAYDHARVCCLGIRETFKIKKAQMVNTKFGVKKRIY